MSVVTWLSTALETVKEWIKTRGLKNVGWLVAFVVSYLLFKEVVIFYAFGFVALGIFIEKNRKALVEIFKELKGKLKK